MPEGYELMQNYPNPFNPVTQISFSIPQQTYVTIKIYNSTGELQVVLFNGNAAAGNYRLEWDAASYPGGLYFCTMTMSNAVLSKKMVLIK
jgi:hypothetical protein